MRKDCPFYNECNRVDCDKECMRKFISDYYFKAGFVPEDKRFKTDLRIDRGSEEEEAIAAQAFTRLVEIEGNIDKFVENGKNLYIYSQNAGTGKTSFAYRMIRSYISKVWFKRPMKPIVMFISVPKFLLELKANITVPSSYIQDIEENVADCDLVVWDDIGSKSGTEFEVSHLLSIIDERINQKKSNIYTSNLDGEELHQLLGDRLYSRIFNGSVCVKIFGKDKRRITANDL